MNIIITYNTCKLLFYSIADLYSSCVHTKVNTYKLRVGSAKQQAHRGNAVARIRLDGNISPFFTFRFDGIRFDGRTPLSLLMNISPAYILLFYRYTASEKTP
jgi:hypothetical protein